MPEVDFLTPIHRATARDYIQRVVSHDKAHCAEVAGQWGFDYWDGERQYGYGGYRYDGRWRPVAQAMADHYGLKPGDRVLDIGCGKAFLLFELTQVVPGLVVAGLDTSAYALEHAPAEVRPFLHLGECDALAFEDASFDFVFSINLFHNLGMSRLAPSLAEMMRVGRDRRYICVESFRNAREKVNLLYWQLTCLSFHSPEDWLFIYDHFGYRGDYSFIYFE